LDVDSNSISNDKHQNNPTNQRQVAFLSNRFFQKKNQSQIRRLKPFEIYKFADKYDTILMIIGTLAG
jgi:hypothetical protein